MVNYYCWRLDSLYFTEPDVDLLTKSEFVYTTTSSTHPWYILLHIFTWYLSQIPQDWVLEYFVWFPFQSFLVWVGTCIICSQVFLSFYRLTKKSSVEKEVPDNQQSIPTQQQSNQQAPNVTSATQIGRSVHRTRAQDDELVLSFMTSSNENI